MTKEKVERKIANCIQAANRANDPSFKKFWVETAKALATKYNADMKEIKKNPEFYNAKISSLH